MNMWQLAFMGNQRLGWLTSSASDLGFPVVDGVARKVAASAGASVGMGMKMKHQTTGLAHLYEGSSEPLIPY